MLSSGSRDRSILQRDTRISPQFTERRLAAHRQEVRTYLYNLCVFCTIFYENFCINKKERSYNLFPCKIKSKIEFDKITPFRALVNS